MRRRKRGYVFAVSFVVLVCALGGSMLAVLLVGVDSEPVGPAASSPVEDVKKAAVVPVKPPGPRRFPVVGLDGHFITVNPDGSSYMEAPDGKKTALAEAGGLPVSEDVIVKKTAELASRRPPKRTEVGQLVVLEKGVIDVPKDAVITFTGPDKVVTHDTDGESTTYYTNGRVERRARPNRVGVDGETKPGKED